MWIFVIYLIITAIFAKCKLWSFHSIFICTVFNRNECFHSGHTYMYMYKVYCHSSTAYTFFFLLLKNTFSHMSSVESQKGVTDTVERYSCWEPVGHYCCTKCMVTVLNGASLHNIYALLVLSQLIFLTLCLFSTTPHPHEKWRTYPGMFIRFVTIICCFCATRYLSILIYLLSYSSIIESCLCHDCLLFSNFTFLGTWWKQNAHSSIAIKPLLLSDLSPCITISHDAPCLRQHSQSQLLPPGLYLRETNLLPGYDNTERKSGKTEKRRFVVFYQCMQICNIHFARTSHNAVCLRQHFRAPSLARSLFMKMTRDLNSKLKEVDF